MQGPQEWYVDHARRQTQRHDYTPREPFPPSAAALKTPIRDTDYQNLQSWPCFFILMGLKETGRLLPPAPAPRHYASVAEQLSASWLLGAASKF